MREAREEAGIDVPVTGLMFAIHWTTPEPGLIRFVTWFFVGQVISDTVRIDVRAILDHRWMRPHHALVEHAVGAIKLAAPTFALTTRLADCPTVESVFEAVADWPDERLLGRLHHVPGGLVAADVACDGRPGTVGRAWPSTPTVDG